ncbi:hypothetical protein P153DRAFT_387556 [Dothidotthia symphoricarpi CBS 119687]|uniref:Uncharacterized protein n=1 Tax=Dothidotthia symphoricarpi CBS 119687 TaxID=1392245 RepID=A0A6A6AAD2_9PLEO|nr:uncharacterized protein P153DRAFT_387556 [Dothidotthia symphoricarpi CBS 119687]KAF2127828.1 hypothetical protein P153DRAFT_387556 [Dothidotthia symphoricarpi CBS 119687]
MHSHIDPTHRVVQAPARSTQTNIQTHRYNTPTPYGTTDRSARPLYNAQQEDALRTMKRHHGYGGLDAWGGVDEYLRWRKLGFVPTEKGLVPTGRGGEMAEEKFQHLKGLEQDGKEVRWRDGENRTKMNGESQKKIHGERERGAEKEKETKKKERRGCVVIGELRRSAAE